MPISHSFVFQRKHTPYFNGIRNCTREKREATGASLWTIEKKTRE